MQRSDIPKEEILLACQQFHDGLASTPEVSLVDRYPRKLILARMQQMVDEGLLDYGVSLATAWVVKKEQRG